MPLVKFWPDLDKQEMRTFAETVPRSEPEKLSGHGKPQQDGSPGVSHPQEREPCPTIWARREEDPFFTVNQFSWQNTDDWKDLNTKFVLMVYRDYVFTGRTDTQFLRDTWPVGAARARVSAEVRPQRRRHPRKRRLPRPDV